MRIFWFLYRRMIITGLSILLIGGLIGLGIHSYKLRGQPSITVITQVQPSIAAPAIQWDSATITRMESEVVSALQCAATQQHAATPPLQHDPALSVQADQSMATLQNDLSLTPEDVFNTHQWWYLDAILETPQSASGSCGWANLDLNTIDFSQFDQIGVAITPPVDYAPANILIIGRKTR